MLKSMTGYGRGEYTDYNRKFVVEIKSVNHRYNDITVKMPRLMSAFEDEVRKTVASAVSRGKTDVYINYESVGDTDVSISVNEALADGYVKALEAIRQRYSLDDCINLNLIAKFPDVIYIDKNIDDDTQMAQIREVLMKAVNCAVENLTVMREKEGQALKSDILDKLNIISIWVGNINKKVPQVVENYKQRLSDRLKETLKDVNYDEGRLLMEITLFADRTCIDEELTRLKSHIEQMGHILGQNDSIGRKLDFLVQEMNREVNTIGSKAGDLEITQIVVDLKAEIEKIREQVQNIE
ncbi:MAG: YicC family protein [Clostridiales bacterium]|jgi:uncharacterized protein (TIGR00255 family)|nr:YicC family protein [Clostridiales bacterium]